MACASIFMLWIIRSIVSLRLFFLFQRIYTNHTKDPEPLTLNAAASRFRFGGITCMTSFPNLNLMLQIQESVIYLFFAYVYDESKIQLWFLYLIHVTMAVRLTSYLLEEQMLKPGNWFCACCDVINTRKWWVKQHLEAISQKQREEIVIYPLSW